MSKNFEQLATFRGSLMRKLGPQPRCTASVVPGCHILGSVSISLLHHVTVYYILPAVRLCTRMEIQKSGKPAKANTPIFRLISLACQPFI